MKFYLLRPNPYSTAIWTARPVHGLHASQGSHHLVPTRFLFILCPLQNDGLQHCVYWVSLYDLTHHITGKLQAHGNVLWFCTVTLQVIVYFMCSEEWCLAVFGSWMHLIMQILTLYLALFTSFSFWLGFRSIWLPHQMFFRSQQIYYQLLQRETHAQGLEQ